MPKKKFSRNIGIAMHFIAMMQRHSVCRTAGSDSRLYITAAQIRLQSANGPISSQNRNNPI